MASTAPKPNSPRSVQVTCAGCGVSCTKPLSQVERNKTGRFFCGPACQARSGSKPRRGEDRTCRCGAVFYARASSRQVTCSVECARAARTEATRETRRCPYCGEAYTTRTSDPRTFCSARCAGNASSGRVSLTCERCEVEFTVRGSEAEARRFCSRACALADKSERATGHKTQAGYVMVRVDGVPQRRCRVVMAELLGRPLREGENVHHRNGVRDDDRPENLELWLTRQPAGQSAADRLAWHRAELAVLEDAVQRLPAD